MKLERGRLIAGKYRLERPLARGGMGSVWVATHELLGVPLAVKFMYGGHDAPPMARARFQREAKVAAGVRCLHVVHVQDYGVENGLPYLVMELLEGEDLEARLRRKTRLSLQAAGALLAQAAKGLRRAHEAGLIHRDLKPSNVFLARSEDDGEIVKILDFGVAKDTAERPGGEDEEQTRAGDMLGSPAYMSPEQIRGRPEVDLTSDLWSLGVVLYRAVTGRLPFGDLPQVAMITRVLADPIPPPSEVAPDLPRALDAFFARVFARDRAQRFQSALEMAEAFRDLTSAGDGRSEPPPRFTQSSFLPAVTAPPETIAARVIVPPSPPEAIAAPAVAPPVERPGAGGPVAPSCRRLGVGLFVGGTLLGAVVLFFAMGAGDEPPTSGDPTTPQAVAVAPAVTVAFPPSTAEVPPEPIGSSKSSPASIAGEPRARPRGVSPAPSSSGEVPSPYDTGRRSPYAGPPPTPPAAVDTADLPGFR